MSVSENKTTALVGINNERCVSIAVESALALDISRKHCHVISSVAEARAPKVFVYFLLLQEKQRNLKWKRMCDNRSRDPSARQEDGAKGGNPRNKLFNPRGDSWSQGRAGRTRQARIQAVRSSKKNKGHTYGSLKNKPRLSLHTGVTETIWHWRIIKKKEKKKKGTAQIHRRAGEVTRRRWK